MTLAGSGDLELWDSGNFRIRQSGGLDLKQPSIVSCNLQSAFPIDTLHTGDSGTGRNSLHGKGLDRVGAGPLACRPAWLLSGPRAAVRFRQAIMAGAPNLR
jgi:hypothetical protein